MTGRIPLVRRIGAALVAITLPAAALLVAGGTADAAIVPTVGMGTADNYSVLGAATVTNTGPSILGESLGLSPGTDIAGFPPGIVLPPGTTDQTNAAAAQAQADLTTAYLNAKNRPVDQNTPADLSGLTLQGGVYAGPLPGKPALTLNGTLTLDGAGDPNSVFIFQTDSSLITGVGSRVNLINNAQECNVFWQVGSSATMGSASDFTGNILALTSIWFTDSVTVHGRALATTGEVTLINDTFVQPLCDLTTPTEEDDTPPTPVGVAASPDLPGSTAGRGAPGFPSGPNAPGTPAGPGTPSGPGTPGTPGTPSGPGTPGITSGPGTPTISGPPRTGATPQANDGAAWLGALLGTVLAGAVAAGAITTRRTRTDAALLARG